MFGSTYLKAAGPKVSETRAGTRKGLRGAFTGEVPRGPPLVLAVGESPLGPRRRPAP
jgi:hypothetical protein